MGLTSRLSIAASGSLVRALDLGEAVAKIGKTLTVDLTDGVTAGKADLVWQDTRTLGVSATEDLDLAGALLDPLQAAAVFARVKGLVVAASSGNTNNVVVGAAATNPWAALLGATGTLTVRPGAVVAAFAAATDAVGYTVTPATGDLLKVANGGAGTSVTYDILVIGASA